MGKSTVLGGVGAFIETTKTLADELRETAINFNEHRYDKVIQSIMIEAISNAQSCAKNGARSSVTYSLDLCTPEVSDSVTKQLRKHGFTVVIDKDKDQNSSCKATMSLLISW